MSDEFKKEIKDLARKYEEKLRHTTASEGSDRGADADFEAVLAEFFKISEDGATIFNESVKEDRLKVYKLPADFLEIFLSIPGRRGGLSIVSPERLAVFFDEDPDVITVIGKLRSHGSSIQANVNKSLQLIKISYSKTDKGYEYKDNTGKALDSGEIIAVIIGWLVSS